MSRDELRAQTPLEVLDALPDTPSRIAGLHALGLEIVKVPVDQLSWILELPLWQLDGRRFQVTSQVVAADPEAFPHHYQRVMAADPSYPIHCVEHRGRLVTLDGVHRLLGARIQGRDLVDAMVLSRHDLDAISR